MEEPLAKPYILIVSGHRSTGDEGDPVERALTDNLAIEYLQRFHAAGYEADWWQESLNMNDDPTMTVGDLTTVARGVARAIADRDDDLVIMMDLHFNGRHSRMHVIVADNIDLHSVLPEGRDEFDTAKNNTLDVKIAREIAKQIINATGLATYNGDLGVAGVMSETESGVGIDGSRLAMFGATAPFRSRSVRMVIEHGGYEDEPVQEPTFFATSAAAAVRAIISFYGGEAGPAPELPAAPLPIAELKPFVSNGAIIGSPPALIVSANGDEFTLARFKMRAIRATWRRQSPSLNAPKLGQEAISVGRTFEVGFQVRVQATGEQWFLTPWWSWIDGRDIEREDV